jgi:hypothetical protein
VVNKKEGEMSVFTPQEITRFKKFLTTQELDLLAKVGTLQVREIVSLVFSILQKRLDCEFETASEEMTKVA